MVCVAYISALFIGDPETRPLTRHCNRYLLCLRLSFLLFWLSCPGAEVRNASPRSVRWFWYGVPGEARRVRCGGGRGGGGALRYRSVDPPRDVMTIACSAGVRRPCLARRGNDVVVSDGGVCFRQEARRLSKRAAPHAVL